MELGTRHSYPYDTRDEQYYAHHTDETVRSQRHRAGKVDLIDRILRAFWPGVAGSPLWAISRRYAWAGPPRELAASRFSTEQNGDPQQQPWGAGVWRGRIQLNGPLPKGSAPFGHPADDLSAVAASRPA
jgi:hypothetical protein